MALTDDILDALGGKWNDKSESVLKDVLHKLIKVHGSGWKESVSNDF